MFAHLAPVLALLTLTLFVSVSASHKTKAIVPRNRAASLVSRQESTNWTCPQQNPTPSCCIELLTVSPPRLVQTRLVSDPHSLVYSIFLFLHPKQLSTLAPDVYAIVKPLTADLLSDPNLPVGVLCSETEDTCSGDDQYCCTQVILVSSLEFRGYERTNADNTTCHVPYVTGLDGRMSSCRILSVLIVSWWRGWRRTERAGSLEATRT